MMTQEEVLRIIVSERNYQESMKDQENSHVTNDFPMSAALLCIEKLLNDAREDWYYNGKPYEKTMASIRKIAAVCVQMGENYGIKEREPREWVGA